VPTLVKDLGPMVEGEPLCAGMSFARRSGYRPQRDSFVVRKLREAGFILLGKTNTPELGILPTTEPRAFGPTRNPYDPDRSTGGSSGGSAAAVALGMVPVAHGNDAGGSIRVPAACCGLVGLKPTRGRVSQGPQLGDFNGGLSVEHVLARSVRDSAALLDVLAGPMPGDPYYAPPPARPFSSEVGADPGALRVGFTAKFLGMTGTLTDAHADCVAAVERAASLLRDLGHQVEEVRLDKLWVPDYAPRFISVWASGVASHLAAWGEITNSKVTADDVEPLTWALGEMGRNVSSTIYLRAWNWLHVKTRELAALWSDHDLLLTPMTAEPPPPLGSFDSTPANPLAPLYRAAAFAPFGPPWNVTGQPAISLPLHRSDSGLPIGVQLVGAYAREDVLLRVAAQLEAASPWVHGATM
jgi:amidase